MFRHYFHSLLFAAGMHQYCVSSLELITFFEILGLGNSRGLQIWWTKHCCNFSCSWMATGFGYMHAAALPFIWRSRATPTPSKNDHQEPTCDHRGGGATAGVARRCWRFARRVPSVVQSNSRRRNDMRSGANGHEFRSCPMRNVMETAGKETWHRKRNFALWSSTELLEASSAGLAGSVEVSNKMSLISNSSRVREPFKSRKSRISYSLS